MKLHLTPKVLTEKNVMLMKRNQGLTEKTNEAVEVVVVARVHKLMERIVSQKLHKKAVNHQQNLLRI